MADRVTSRSLTTLLNYVIQAFGERRDHGRGGLSFLGLVLTSLLTEKSMDMIEGEELEYLGRKGKQDKVF